MIGNLRAILALLFLASGPVFAADHYIRAGATGANNGNNWTDAFTTIPATLIRGDTYYVAGGSYGARTFNTPVSGTSVITLKGATVANHGIATGWSDSYAVENSQAHFGLLTFTTSYFVIDGSVGSMTETPTAYGFMIDANVSAIIIGNGVGTSHSDFRFSHIYAKATASDVEKLFLQSGFQVAQADNITVSHCLLDGWQNGMMSRGQGSGQNDNWLFEYNMALRGSSTSANHGEWINANSKQLINPIVRYNIFRGQSGSGQTAIIVANNSGMSGAQVYGNVFDSFTVGNGILAGTSVATLNNSVFYNNTIVNCTAHLGWVNAYGGSGNLAYNNLLYNMSGAIGSGFTLNYNAYFSVSSAPGESNKQTGTGNPFRDLAGLDYRLAANTVAGTALPSPYNVDALGNVRTSWTRGAYEFGTAVTNPVISITPASLSFGSVVISLTRDLTITVRNIGGGTLSGTVTVAAPFTVVSGGTYSLSANQSQTVTIRFAPLSVLSYSQNITFTGGGGATATASAAGILASANTPPTVSNIAQNAADVDPNTVGIQVYEGTVAQYSGSASDANGDSLTWQWIYTINGGAEVIYQSGAGTVTPASFSYGASTAGRTYLWKLRVSDGVATTESQLSVGISAPPVVGAGINIEAEAGTITAPFASAGGAISQATMTDLAGGGRATYTFSVTNAGEYAIQAYVNAPGLTENSFYVNIDSQPQEPTMSWDILPPTVGFENRLVSWRGNGTADANELVPKFFTLSAGTHQLIIIGREANVQLDRFVIFKRPAAPSNLRSLVSNGQ